MATLQEVDRELTRWKADVDAAGSNMIDLNTHWVYQILVGPPPVALAGRSALEVKPALDAMASLWPRFALLTDLMKRCDELRKQAKSSLLGSNHDQVAQQITALLTTKSIKLAVREIPLAQRNLLSAAASDDCISPADMLKAMVEAFAQANAAVHKVEQCWERLNPALNTPQQQIAQLIQQAKDMGEGEQPELEQARQALDAIKQTVLTNPLEAVVDLDGKVTRAIANTSARLSELATARQQVEEQLASAPSLFDQLVGENTAAATALAACREKVVDQSTTASALSDSVIEAQRSWLGRLQTKLASGDWKPLRVGIKRWQEVTADYLKQATGARRANQALLDKREELRGLLNALKAKAQAIGLAEETLLEQLARLAHDAAWLRPTDLSKAESLVLEYQRRLLLRDRLNKAKAKALSKGVAEDAALISAAAQATPLLEARPSNLDQAERAVGAYEVRLATLGG